MMDERLERAEARIAELTAENEKLAAAFRQLGREPNDCLEGPDGLACVGLLAYQNEKQSREAVEAKLTALQARYEARDPSKSQISRILSMGGIQAAPPGSGDYEINKARKP